MNVISRGTITPKQLPSGNWRVQVAVTIDGKLHRESFTAKTAKQARLDALNWQAEIKERHKPANVTLFEAVNSYIEINRNVFSPSTIRGYMSIKRNHLDDIGNLKVSAITTNILQEKVNNLLKTKSPKTVNNVFYLLKPAIHHVDKHKVFDDINLPKEGTLTPKKRQKKALPQSEAKQILKTLEGESIELPVLFAAWLGLRRSEILALEWDDIDFDNKLVYIEKALVPDEHNKFVIKGVKTETSGRTLLVPDYIIEKLKTLERTGDRIFNIPASRLSQGFPKVCKKILGKPYTFHDLRRTMASYGLAMGINEETMMTIGGWSSPQTMRKFYQVVFDDDKVEAQNKIDSLFNALIQE